MCAGAHPRDCESASRTRAAGGTDSLRSPARSGVYKPKAQRDLQTALKRSLQLTEGEIGELKGFDLDYKCMPPPPAR